MIMPTNRAGKLQHPKAHLIRRGIIPSSALWPLCRYRHNGHATGHPSRLNRDLRNSLGSPDYAREELRAEIAQVMVWQSWGLASASSPMAPRTSRRGSRRCALTAKKSSAQPQTHNASPTTSLRCIPITPLAISTQQFPRKTRQQRQPRGKPIALQLQNKIAIESMAPGASRHHAAQGSSRAPVGALARCAAGRRARGNSSTGVPHAAEHDDRQLERR